MNKKIKIGTKKVILIVEDNSLLAGMYQEIFRSRGYEVDIGFDGEEAIGKLEALSQKPAIILLDILLPRRDGFEVLRYIKENDNLKNIPVIILTNLKKVGDAEKALELGAVLYLIKTDYTPKQIVGKVEEVIEAYSPSSRR